MDFTLKTYRGILKHLLEQNYVFQTMEDFIREPKVKAVILRHDVDLLPQNSLDFAKIQAELGIKGVYYFREVPESWDEKVIREISALGHEIGYHYESLTTCNGDLDLAIRDFEKNLNALRKLTPVSTICMHGSPMSKYDSKDLWKKYDYRNFQIIAEPYFDIDFSKVLYLTDTGRRWDGSKVSVRDKVVSPFTFKIHSTKDLLQLIATRSLPDQIMFTFHPQRWTDSKVLWLKELLMQKVKNLVKRVVFVR